MEKRNITRFEEYLLEKDKINLDGMDEELIDTILAYYRPYAIVGLYADMYTVMHENWLKALNDKKNKTYEELSDFSTLSLTQKSRVTHDRALIEKLQSIGITISYHEREEFFPQPVMSMSQVFDVCRKIEKLNEQGLDEYIEKVVVSLLGEEDYLYLGKTTDGDLDKWDINPGLQLSVSTRPKIRRIIREYQRSTK